MTLFRVTDLALLTRDRGRQWKQQKSSSRHEDQPQWKHQGRWRWASRLRCSTSLENIWWWYKTCGRCWLPHTDALPRHRQLICLGQNGSILSIPNLQTEIEGLCAECSSLARSHSCTFYFVCLDCYCSSLTGEIMLWQSVNLHKGIDELTKKTTTTTTTNFYNEISEMMQSQTPKSVAIGA